MPFLLPRPQHPFSAPLHFHLSFTLPFPHRDTSAPSLASMLLASSLSPPSSTLPSACVGALPTLHQSVPCALITQTPRAEAWHCSNLPKAPLFSLTPERAGPGRASLFGLILLPGPWQLPVEIVAPYRNPRAGPRCRVEESSHSLSLCLAHCVPGLGRD